MPIQCPHGTSLAGGAYPAGQAHWWILSDYEREKTSELPKFWPFRAWDSMISGDKAWWCENARGLPQGPTWQLRLPTSDGRLGGWIKGNFDENGKPDGTWNWGWNLAHPKQLAFQGVYHHGERVGEWSFYAPAGRHERLSAKGSFKRDRFHGTWVMQDDDKRIEARYVYGIPHGNWHEVFADGSEIRGRYFNGTKNYEWAFLAPDPESGKEQIIKQEAWKYDTFVTSWDPRVDPNPIPGLDLPGDPLGPDAEGMCKVHATCASNMYLSLMLAGLYLDEDQAYNYPFLVDFADPQARQPDRDRMVLVDSYKIVHMDVAEDETHGSATVAIKTRCEVGGPGTPIEPMPGTETVKFDLRDENGVWKLVRPLPTVYTRFGAYLEKMSRENPSYSQQVRQICG